MKAVILHGIGNNHTGNWFPWLKGGIESIGYEVWVPDLPRADRPNLEGYTKFLLNNNWDFSNNLVIGHSAGAVEVLDLLQNLPENSKINTAIMVAVFQGGLGWEALQDLEGVKFDFEKIKTKANRFIVIHSDDDPYCPLEGAEGVAKDLGAKMVILKGMKHFSLNTNPKMSKFPELLQIIKDEVPSK